jgi:hypothetical protein
MFFYEIWHGDEDEEDKLFFVCFLEVDMDEGYDGVNFRFRIIG